MILGDYHIHSRFSGGGHGKNTVGQLWLAAQQKGLQQIGIADHGVKHAFYGTDEKKLGEARKIIDGLNGQGKTKILLGIEANLISDDGKIDCGSCECLDFVAMGYHKLIKSEAVQAGRFVLPALFKSKSKKKVFTQAYVKAIEKYPIGFVTHLKRDMDVDVLEVAKAMSDYGVLLELNGKRVDLTDDELGDVLTKTEVGFILGSDAHREQRVGDVARPYEVVRRLGIPADRIANEDKLPDFRRPK